MKSYLCRLTLLTLGTAGLAAMPALAVDAPAGDWSQWRGPHFDGTSDAKNLPTEFGLNKNVTWSVKLPGPSNNTPIIVGDRVFATAVDSARKMYVLCVDRKAGKILWQNTVATAQISPKGENDVAAPSPVTDGKVVVFLFGTGDIFAYDIDGKPLWSRNLQREVGEWNINWIYGSSPTLWKGKLYIQVLHREIPWKGTELPGAAKYEGDVPSYLLALEPATGKQLWKVNRPTEAVNETKESYATPIPHKTKDGREELLIVGGDAVTGQDPETGKELWRFTGWDPKKEPFWRLIPSVVAGGGYIVACAPKGGPVMGIKEGGDGDVSASHKAWFTDGKQISSDVPVPLYYQDHFFVLDAGGKKLTKIKPATGEAVWQTKLEGGAGKSYARASPLGADGHVYCMNADGMVWVVNPEDGKVISSTALEGSKNARGSIAAVDGMLVVRVGDTLYAFGKTN